MVLTRTLGLTNIAQHWIYFLRVLRIDNFEIPTISDSRCQQCDMVVFCTSNHSGIFILKNHIRCPYIGVTIHIKCSWNWVVDEWIILPRVKLHRRNDVEINSTVRLSKLQSVDEEQPNQQWQMRASINVIGCVVVTDLSSFQLLVKLEVGRPRWLEFGADGN